MYHQTKSNPKEDGNMRRSILVSAVLVVCLLLPAAGWALAEPSADETAEILAETEEAIGRLEASETVKTRLRLMTRTWIRVGTNEGLTGEQLREMTRAMVRLCRSCDLERDAARLNAACRLMVQAMRTGMTCSETCLMLQTRLENGQRLGAAIEGVRQELAAGTQTKSGQGTAEGQQHGGGPKGPGGGAGKG